MEDKLLIDCVAVFLWSLNPKSNQKKEQKEPEDVEYAIEKIAFVDAVISYNDLYYGEQL